MCVDKNQEDEDNHQNFKNTTHKVLNGFMKGFWLLLKHSWQETDLSSHFSSKHNIHSTTENESIGKRIYKRSPI